MRLAEMTELPTRAGQAELFFVNPEDNKTIFGRDYFPLPSRRENRIFLPRHGNDEDDSRMEFVSLKNGQQFIFYKLDDYGDLGGWFGGWDESSAFLTEITPEAVVAYKIRGEPKFYDYLKPEAIHFLEKHTGRSSIRQGDIFLFPLGISWEVVTGLSLAFLIEEVIEPKEVQGYPVLDTRHRFTGLYGEDGYSVEINEAGLELAWAVFAFGSQGVLEAPDHKPAEIRGVHLIQQARGLFDPAAAD